MRFAIPLLAALVAVSLVGCAGDDEETAAPIPVAQRFVTAADAPGSKPDPVETRQTTEDFDEFLRTLSERAVNPDEEEMRAVFEEAGFQGAGLDARFFGENHDPDPVPHVFSSQIELESEDGAESALDWLETDALKPCPGSCAVETSDFDVDVSDGRGVHRSATAADIERLGTADQEPFESYWVGFTVGPVVYTMELYGPPGSVTEEQAQEIASAYRDRLAGG